MSIDVNDEILQDFLVEAGEILEQLSEQLVDLEQQPDDFDLLNAVFRGFHTIKGGAGFLSIEPLVEVCHRAEDVFNVLRQGQRSVRADLMDSILEVLDVVNTMFDHVREGIVPDHADPELIQRLNRFTVPEGDETPEPDGNLDAKKTETVLAKKAADEHPSKTAKHDLSDSEFNELLDAIQDPEHSSIQNDDISEEEFEALLDELHGKGQFSGGVPKSEDKTTSKTTPEDSQEITEDEFEDLLDQIHGKGQFDPSKTQGNDDSKLSKKPKHDQGDDEITEEEFDSLLNEIHGEGKFNPTVAASPCGEKQPASNKGTDSARQKADKQTRDKLETASSSVQTRSEKQPAEKKLQPKPKAATETTVRVDTQRLDDIMNMVGELVLVRNRLANLRATMKDEEVANAVSNLDVVTADLQLAVMKTRMQPIKKVFGRFPRVVRDLARSLKREIDLEMEGEDTDLDKNLVEALADPLVHLVRNAVDHGIEMPDERERAGKPRRGNVLLSAAQEGDHILLSISDDGKGMDPEVLRRKAVEKGMMDQEAAARLDDRECYNLIFQAGFSTKKEISDVSGRGVGMDVVKTRIAQMNGSVEIDSELGRGSLITIKLPLTLAILPTLMVVLKQQPFALPLASVVEIFNLDLSRTNVVDGQLTIMVRERAIPLFYLREWLISNSLVSNEDKQQSHVVIVNVGNVQVGLVVDDLIGQEEVVIKPLGAMLQGLEGMAGATITGDGKIALIIDVPGLMRKYARKY
ncbi:MAG: chemotaxis protein CheA [Gammaproteobacteria bacterium]|nr:chemotaxis protein CheA [Gammaproteobacteria bacterium]